MFYIISPVSIDELKKFSVPYIKGTGMLDIEGFYASKEGKKFQKISPISIKRVNNKKDLQAQIAADISFISLCYNCPLYIYVMKDSSYFHELSLGFISHNNYGKVNQLFELKMKYNSYDFPEAKELKVPMEKTYYKGNLEKIDEAVKTALKPLNLKKNPINAYKLTTKDGIS